MRKVLMYDLVVIENMEIKEYEIVIELKGGGKGKEKEMKEKLMY